MEDIDICDIYHEGLRLLPCKLYEGGVPNLLVFNSIGTSCRRKRSGIWLPALALVQEWAQSTAVSVSQIQEVLRAMETGASYFPGRRDPLFAWWQSIMNR